jgi:hypothetical protein
MSRLGVAGRGPRRRAAVGCGNSGSGAYANLLVTAPTRILKPYRPESRKTSTASEVGKPPLIPVMSCGQGRRSWHQCVCPSDLRRPWEKPTDPGKLTPARARRGFRNLRTKTILPTCAPKPTRPGPGRPLGSKNHPAPRHEVGRVLATGEAYSRPAHHIRNQAPTKSLSWVRGASRALVACPCWCGYRRGESTGTPSRRFQKCTSACPPGIPCVRPVSMKP